MNDPVDSLSATAAAPLPPSATTLGDSPSAAARHGDRVWRNPWFFIALIALALASWQWLETRSRLARTQQEVARRLSESDTLARESRAAAKQAQEKLTIVEGKLGELEARIAESKSQQATLETLYQNLAQNHEESALAEVEQGVTLAAQQLQLAGNVQAAVLALQAADARLAGNNRPQFSALRKVLLRDLDRLQALPQVDLVGMSLRLEGAIAAIDGLPLAVSGRPRDEDRDKRTAPNETAPAVSSLAFWERLAGEFWAELRGLVRIQRFDREEPALLAPGQAFFLRENLKLRLLSARLAFLARDEWALRNELRHAQSWVDRYFDGRDKSVQGVQAALKQLSATDIRIEVPNLNESLSAIKNFKPVKERK